MRQLPTRLSFIGGAFALLLLAAGCASNQPAQTAQSEPDMLIASGFMVRTPNSTQQTKLQSLTAGQISVVQTSRRTLYVYPDWPNNRVLIGGPAQYQAYLILRVKQNLPVENPPQVYRGPSSFDWSKWYSEGG
jgi:ABC-type Fe3+-hydroxamate transport system substrate-binding protein